MTEVTFIPYDERYTAPTVFTQLFGFFAQRDVPACIYGSAVRDHFFGVPWREGQDIDVSVCGKAWCGDSMRQERKEFAMNLPHQRFVTQMMMQGKVAPFMVMRLLAESPLIAETGQMAAHPFEISVARKFEGAASKIADTDIGICGIAADQQGLWVTEAFQHDNMNETLTVARCRDVRDASRTVQRLAKLQEIEFFADWTIVWPSAFEDFRAEAQAELDAKAATVAAE